MTVREAEAADVERMVALADATRRVYGEQEPVFQRPAVDAVEVHRPWLARLVADPEVGTFVHEPAEGIEGIEGIEGVDGFVVVTLVPAPPVYDLGGLSSLVDDFAVASSDLWASVAQRCSGGRAPGRESAEPCRSSWSAGRTTRRSGPSCTGRDCTSPPSGSRRRWAARTTSAEARGERQAAARARPS